MPDYNKRYYLIIALLTILAVIALAIIFVKERTCVSDMAYMLVVQIIERRVSWWFVRIGAVIPQFFTLTAIWMHGSLRTVMIMHSISTQLFYLILFFIAYRYSRRTILFFLIPLNLVLMINEVFFWPISEVQQGIVWLCLYAVFLFEKKWEGRKTPSWLAIHFIFLLWIQFLHPLMFFPIIFLVLYYYAGESQLLTRRAFYHYAICIVVFGLRRYAGKFNEYENARMQMSRSIRPNLSHFFSLGATHTFIGKLTSAYLIYILLLLAALVWLLIYRRYMKAAILAAFTIGYWVLVMAFSGEDARFYTENMLLPLAFMVILTFVADMVPALDRRYALACVVFVIIIRLGFMYHSHIDYTARFAMYEPYFRYIKENKLNGVFVDDKLVDQKKAIVTWSSGCETMLLSALASPDSCMVVQMDPDPNHFNWAVNSDTMLVTFYGAWGKSNLPREYFKPQGGKYQVITKPL